MAFKHTIQTTLTVLVVAVGVALVSGTSDGNFIGECDVYSERWGCATENYWNGDHLNCTNAAVDGLLMQWATKPVRSDDYTLHVETASDGTLATSYVPDALYTVVILTRVVARPIRGIMMYATNGTAGDANKARVGQWQPTSGSPPVFQPASVCENTVLHYYGVEKGSKIAIVWRAPPAGSGAVHFEALLKYGGPNNGDFYWPNVQGDVVLAEAAAPAPAPGPATATLWVKSLLGQSCDEACTDRTDTESTYVCDAAQLAQVDSVDAVVALQQANVFCNRPVLATCSDVAPSAGVDDVCSYNAPAVCDKAGRAMPAITCKSKSTADNNGQRICPCVNQQALVDAENNRNGASSSSPAASVQSMRSVLLAVSLPLLASGLNGRVSMALIASVALFSMIEVSSAHNWFTAPSRNQHSASTVQPVPIRKGAEYHVQVGPDQQFQTEWVTAHGNFMWFAMVHADNYSKLSSLNYNMIDSYLSEDSFSATMANDPMWMRYHRRNDQYNINDIMEAAYATNQTDFWEAIIGPEDPTYIPRPAALNLRYRQFMNMPISNAAWLNTTHYMFKYKSTTLNLDRRSNHYSVKYPYIECAAKFGINAMQSVRPDFAQFTVPGRGGFGHYILMWGYLTYKDAIDIDYVPTAVANVYGTAPPAGTPVKYMRFDHSQYLNPNRVTSTCRMVTSQDISICLNECASKDIMTCPGVNVIPIDLPSVVPPYLQSSTLRMPYTPSYPGAGQNVSNTTCPQHWFENGGLDAYKGKGLYLCFGVAARADASDMIPAITTSSDILDPIFYSTAHQRLRSMVFEQINPPEIIKNPTNWLYQGGCLACDDYVASTQPNASYIPWIVPTFDQCEDCAAAVTEPRTFPSYNIPMNVVTTNARLARNPSFSCADVNNTCLINVRVFGGYDPTLMIPSANPTSHRDCAIFASVNPNCSSVVSVQATTNNGQYTCQCYSKDPCCKNPYYSVATYSTYDVSPTVTLVADPTCATGTLVTLVNGTFCCPKVDNFNNISNSSYVMACTQLGNTGKVNQSCVDYSAPCWMNRPSQTTTTVATIATTKATKMTTASTTAVPVSKVDQSGGLDASADGAKGVDSPTVGGLSRGALAGIVIGVVVAVVVLLLAVAFLVARSFRSSGSRGRRNGSTTTSSRRASYAVQNTNSHSRTSTRGAARSAI